jgi:hypothetical protein
VPEPVVEPKVIEEDVAVVEEEQKLELKEGEVEIGAETAEWQEVASAETMNELFAQVEVPPPFKPANDSDGEPIVFKPVKVNQESAVSRDGAFAINFNQRMKVPDFIDNSMQPVRDSRLLQKSAT